MCFRFPACFFKLLDTFLVSNSGKGIKECKTLRPSEINITLHVFWSSDLFSAFQSFQVTQEKPGQYSEENRYIFLLGKEWVGNLLPKKVIPSIIT